MRRLFGTFGIRRVANEVLTPEMATKLALSFGTFISGEQVVVGRDARKHSEMLYYAVISGLLSTGCSVTELGVTTTPALQWACRQWNQWGAMITASHNPPQWNGIKFMEKTGKGLDREKDEEVEKIFNEYLKTIKPEFIIIQYGGTDDSFHKYGPYSDEAREAVIKADLWLSRCIENLKAESYGIMILADHGQHNNEDKSISLLGIHGSDTDEDRIVPFTWTK